MDKPETKPDIFDSARDWLLCSLVESVNGSEAHVNIILNVKGSIIHGELVSGHLYFSGVAGDMLSSQPGNEAAIELAKSFIDYGKQIYIDSNNIELAPDKVRKVIFIHLRNMHVIGGDGKAIPGNKGVWWRGKIESIDGFILGSLTTEQI